MKVSTVIQQLTGLLLEHGDLDVVVRTEVVDEVDEEYPGVETVNKIEKDNLKYLNNDFMVVESECVCIW